MWDNEIDLISHIVYVYCTYTQHIATFLIKDRA